MAVHRRASRAPAGDRVACVDGRASRQRGRQPRSERRAPARGSVRGHVWVLHRVCLARAQTGRSSTREVAVHARLFVLAMATLVALILVNAGFGRVSSGACSSGTLASTASYRMALDIGHPEEMYLPSEVKARHL